MSTIMSMSKAKSYESVIKNQFMRICQLYFGMCLLAIEEMFSHKLKHTGTVCQFKTYFYVIVIIQTMNAFYVLLLALMVMGLGVAKTYDSYEEYVKKYKKNYPPGEYEERKKKYDALIQSFSTITQYTPGVNELSDLFEEELEAYRTLQQLPQEAQSSNKLRASAGKLGAPTSLDWRDKNAVTIIKNQGSCGCCWAFSSIAYVESKLIIAGKYTPDNIDLSEQFMLKCTKLSGCDGGYLEYALQSVREVPTEQTYPYSPYSTAPVDCSATGIKTGFTVENYYTLGDEELKDLLQTSPVPISISSDGWQKYGSGVYQCLAGARVNHAVLLVGYTPDYWIIKNQWGPNWGEDGYIRVTRNSSKNCKIGTSAHILFGPSLRQLVALALPLLLFFMQ